MKRMIAFFIVIVFLIGFKIVFENNLPNLEFDSMIVISKTTQLDREYLQNGEDFYYNFDKIEGQEVLKGLDVNEIKGLVFYFDNIDINDLLNKTDFYYEGEEVDGMKVYYGYDSSYLDFRYINGKKINIQIVQNSTKTIVGYPMILCGF